MGQTVSPLPVIGCGALAIVLQLGFWGLVILALAKFVFGWSPF